MYGCSFLSSTNKTNTVFQSVINVKFPFHKRIFYSFTYKCKIIVNAKGYTILQQVCFQEISLLIDLYVFTSVKFWTFFHAVNLRHKCLCSVGGGCPPIMFSMQDSYRYSVEEKQEELSLSLSDSELLWIWTTTTVEIWFIYFF